MPKTEIDYSNTIIYKITCKNPAITEVYVGHTTNFVQRKHAHKQNCKNEKSPNHTCKLYKVIRANGGWTNWQMEIINFFNCADHYAARKKEQEYFISLNATLNSIEPFPKPKIIVNNKVEKIKKPVYFCETCNINCTNSNTFDTHNKTKKHEKNLIGQLDANSCEQPISPKQFVCSVCSISCAKNAEWLRHINTRKHKINESSVNVDKIGEKSTLIACKCGKKYKDRSGLWRHEKKCDYKPESPKKPKLYEKNDIVDVLIKENENYKNMMLEMMKSNTDLQKQMLEMCKNGVGGNYKSHNNNHNKTFNLQFFLNEQCKDAMNLTDFVDSMTLEFSDLEDVGKLGYVEGISKIMIRKLNELDIYKRPIHCSDAKREIMYVKEHNVWEKEKNSNQHIRKAIKRVTHKNGGLLVPWSLENPNCMNLDHHLNDVYLRMMGQSMGGSGEFVDNENKIMKKIAKAVFIDKL